MSTASPYATLHADDEASEDPRSQSVATSKTAKTPKRRVSTNAGSRESDHGKSRSDPDSADCDDPELPSGKSSRSRGSRWRAASPTADNSDRSRSRSVSAHRSQRGRKRAPSESCPSANLDDEKSGNADATSSKFGRSRIRAAKQLSWADMCNRSRSRSASHGRPESSSEVKSKSNPVCDDDISARSSSTQQDNKSRKKKCLGLRAFLKALFSRAHK